MKKVFALSLAVLMALSLLAGCGGGEDTPVQDLSSAVRIVLSDSGVTVDGAAAPTDEDQAVYTANDIIYYEDGHDFTYGEGTEDDAHSKEEAAAHTVVHIAEPGTYVLSGSLSKGQIAVDLGEDADKDPGAVVTLVLDGVDITCHVAPGVIFYNVYECGDADVSSAEVDTSAAGANVIIADGTENTVRGSYVARIYKPDSVELNEDGTEVKDAKKLHKYDGAFYSKMSMNVDGGGEGTGVLNIFAENEGVDTELHLTINGGDIRIRSGNDGINTNEDNVSVTTVNGGSLDIVVDGSTGEGDGIDSNGYLVINGGTVRAQACGFSADAGIDSDMGIHINGGLVMASGNMLDGIEEGGQNFAVFQFAQGAGAGVYTLKDKKENTVAEYTAENSFSYLILSGPDLKAGDHTLWQGDTRLQGMASEGFGMGPGMGFQPGQMPEGMDIPGGMDFPEGMEMPEGMDIPGGMDFPEGMDIPGGMDFSEGMEMPEGMTPPEGMGKPGERPGGFGGGAGRQPEGAAEDTFTIQKGANYFAVYAAK